MLSNQRRRPDGGGIGPPLFGIAIPLTEMARQQSGPRRPLGETDGNSRVVCIDQLFFDEKGFIKPVIITKEGVGEKLIK